MYAQDFYNAILMVFALVVLYKIGVAALAQWDLAKVPADGRQWNVVSSYPNSQAGAELLAKTHRRLIGFMDAMRHKYHIDESADTVSAEGGRGHSISDTEAASYIRSLLKGYNPDTVYENDPRKSADTSYTVAKGAATYFCIRDRQNPNLLEEADDMFFVALHECAHIANYKSWSHDPQFWTVFKFILREARDAGFYTPRDYAAHPEQYCGLTINYQPLNDTTLRDI